MSQYRTCRKCKEYKSIKEFYKRKKSQDGRQYHCKDCSKQLSTSKHKFDPKESKLALAKWRANNPNRNKNIALKKYGISYVDYEEMLKDQNHSCAICHKHESLNKKDLAVDHCHKTGYVRGLLCNNCNSALGLFKDNIKYINRAMEYLKSRINNG